MKVVTFFAVTVTTSPLFAEQDIEINIEVDESYYTNRSTPKINKLHYHIPEKNGGSKIFFWEPSDGSCTKTISIPEGKMQSILVFLYTVENDPKYYQLFEAKTPITSLVKETIEEEGDKKQWPLRSLTIKIGKYKLLSDLDYGDIEMCETQEDHTLEDESS